uniref:Dishevelled/Egl-10/leckstrin domain protein n=1 Tax=Angiostrongylus cantonensis TaxID=6313 RepID=A0A0K0DK30_ANGCA
LAITDFSQPVEPCFPQATETKVYYYLDDDTTPFVSILPVPPELATLKDFKKVFTKKGFKYFCKGLDADIKREVKIELVDDSAPLKRSSNGLFELFLHSLARSGTLPRRGQADYMCDLGRAGEHLAELYTSNSENFYKYDEFSATASSSLYEPLCANGAYNDVGKVRRRKPRKERFRKAYVPSTISSITESSLSLPRILEVNLSMRTTPYLGISVGSFQGSILVSEILPDGAVAKDGRIEVGDQIVQVNNRSFENLTEAQAVRLLREVAAAKKPLVLFVAKYSRGNDYDPLSSLASETLPLDVSLWVQTAACVLQSWLLYSSWVFKIRVCHTYFEHNRSERALYAQRRHGIPHQNIEELERRRENEQNGNVLTMDPVVILRALARPDSGLQVKNRKWLKILVPMSFIGRDLVDWLLEHVEDLSDRKAARQYAAELLKAGLIRHVVSKLTFTEKCYYVFGDAIVGVRGGADSTQNSGGTLKVEATTEVTYVGSPAPTGQRDVLYDFVSRLCVTCVLETWLRNDCESPVVSSLSFPSAFLDYSVICRGFLTFSETQL